MVAISSTTRVSCEGNMEKTNVYETDMADKKKAKGNLTILFTNDKAILPGAVLSCLRDRQQSLTLCESRTLTQFRYNIEQFHHDAPPHAFTWPLF